MTVEVINTGSELLLGRVLNTHQQWLCRRLTDEGYEVIRQTTVPDRGDSIETAVREALGRADLVITTGGLGSTGDDLTRERIASLLGRKLTPDPAITAHVRHFFESRGRAVPSRTHLESLVPEGAIVLANRHGTAPGLALKVSPNPIRETGDDSWLIMLPGPPRELHPMFRNEVLPLLRREIPPREKSHSVTLRTTGLGESLLEERLLPSLERLLAEGLELGFCARIGEVEVRLSSQGTGAAALVSRAQAAVREAIGEFIFGTDEELLEAVMVRELTHRRQTLALAESCTGGFIAHKITNIPGASAVLLAGYVTYANTAKTDALGVRPETLAEHGAVSEPVARQMAEGARQRAQADYALAVTGVAGPGGGTDAKPVGTVFIALAAPEGTKVVKHFNPFDRETFKFATCQQALDLLRRHLERQSP